MTRTTLDLDAVIPGDLRERSRRERKPMGSGGLGAAAPPLKDGQSAEAAQPFEWRSWHMGKAKVDLEPREAAQRIFDEQDG